MRLCCSYTFRTVYLRRKIYIQFIVTTFKPHTNNKNNMQLWLLFCSFFLNLLFIGEFRKNYNFLFILLTTDNISPKFQIKILLNVTCKKDAMFDQSNPWLLQRKPYSVYFKQHNTNVFTCILGSVQIRYIME